MFSFQNLKPDVSYQKGEILVIAAALAFLVALENPAREAGSPTVSPLVALSLPFLPSLVQMLRTRVWL